ncbi:uncharacterized protein [Euphorbia lathyris]|uniref:uncharacterized protein n=1 Tax=Euphorbia lathyris TaxID=212925 RepID=UPI003314437D
MSIRHFSSKSLLFPSPSSPFPYSIFVSHFCSSSTLPSRLNFPQRHLEEESRNVRVSVWWDFENCNLPAGVNVFKVAPTITAAIRETGIKGPIQITAFGDVLQLSRVNQEALTSTGIQLTHVPRGGKNSADRSLLVDLMCWVSQNPPPAHLFLISGDRDFASVLHRLRMSNYNIMLASVDHCPSVLCSAASVMWRWNALVRGDCLTGKVFNQPPDGPYGSWYGNYTVSLEDPFSVEQPTLPQTEELNKIRPVPKAVMKQIKDILSSHPKGITIDDLRSQLNFIDRDYYGYRRFYRFLMSMPNILKLQTSNGAHIIHGIGIKPKPVEPNSCLSNDPLTSYGIECHPEPIKPEGGEISVSESVVKDPLMSSSLESSTEGSASKVRNFPDEAVSMDNEKPLKESVAFHSHDEVVEVANSSVGGDSISPVIEQDSKTEVEVGFLKKIRRRWFGRTEDGSAIDKHGPQVDSLGKTEDEKKIVEPSSQESYPVSPTSNSLSSSGPTPVKETNISLDPYDGERGKIPSLRNRILQWCKVGGKSPDPDVTADQPGLEPKQIQSHSGKHEIFSEDSFWRDMDSFFNSEQGSLVISQSKTREEMATYMQKDGPLILKTLTESDVLQLVDILVSEKKWVEEYPFEASPFKLTRCSGQHASSGHSHTSSGLASIFSSSSLKSDTKRQPDHKEDGKPGGVENISHAGDSKPVGCTKPSGRYKKKTLIDCKKLVSEILKEFPEGYNLSGFKVLFQERYGYDLDVQKLGYNKLASLLQIIPGVKVESTFMVPSDEMPKVGDVPNSCESNSIHSSATSGSELSDTLQSDEPDSTWEELGPIEEKCAYPQYEPFVSDDEFSESEGEASPVAQLQGQAKSRMDSEDSSLLRILDSWYSSKDGVNRKEKSENVQDMMNSSSNGKQTCNQSGTRSKSGTSLEKHGKKQRPQKSYCFVADPDAEECDGNGSGSNDPNKLIDGIIGRLKTAKSGGVRMRS